MGIPAFLSIVLVLCAIMSIVSNNVQSRDRKKIKDFLNEQSKVYVVPRERLNEINFLKLDFSKYDFKIVNPETKREIKTLTNFQKLKLANFKNLSNEELKQTYGTNNFEEVLEYQNNFDNLLISLLKASELLYKDGDEKNAINLLNLSISLGNDVTKNYTLLADIYAKNNMRKELFSLVDLVKSNKNISQAKIMEHIKKLQSKELKEK